MLSNETRLKRINERLLETFNCYIGFEKECNVIYRPYLYLDIAIFLVFINVVLHTNPLASGHNTIPIV